MTPLVAWVRAGELRARRGGPRASGARCRLSERTGADRRASRAARRQHADHRRVPPRSSLQRPAAGVWSPGGAPLWSRWTSLAADAADDIGERFEHRSEFALIVKHETGLVDGPLGGLLDSFP